MKKIGLWVTGIIVVALAAGCIYVNGLMDVITGYAAKNLCSAVFISGRDAQSVENLDLNFFPIQYTNNEIDYEHKTVVSRFLWGSSKAIYREGFGSVILQDADETLLKNTPFPVSLLLNFGKDTVVFPLGDKIPDTIFDNVNCEALQQIAVQLIDSQSYHGTPFSFMVVYKNIPVVEHYKSGFDQNTRLLSWSMAKSFTNALAGVMTQHHLLDINATTGIAEWQNDDRKLITINDLMQMQSGLQWNEDYGNKSDVNVMLHDVSDMAAYAIRQPLQAAPGTEWYYSSGSTNIVCALMKEKFSSNNDYFTFIEQQFFQKMGFENAIFETDETGTFIGSSYIYATTKDFARFGLLYLNDGCINGERLLPEGWVDYTITPASASDNQYGSFFWLNKSNTFPDIPEDAYYCSGHDGQKIFIIPSHEVVIVLLGYSPLPEGVDFNRLVKDVLDQIAL
ncbi:MAG: serine hydrolase [Bacteroidales bacterium]|nr:serine hydrolase [Bacteroidales bacterium]